MEFCGSRTLSMFLQQSTSKTLGGNELKSIFRQIIIGVQFLHTNSIYHRDLKLENILLTTTNQIKIVDLGLATTSDDHTTSMCGTPAYFTPEHFRHQPYTPSKTDVWCLGVILFYMAFGKHPFGGNFIINRLQGCRIRSASRRI